MLDVAVQCTDGITGIKGCFLYDVSLGIKAIGYIYPDLVDLFNSLEYKAMKNRGLIKGVYK